MGGSAWGNTSIRASIYRGALHPDAANSRNVRLTNTRVISRL